ncbi:MAG: hypothetical protein R2813_07495 [Flavobacteriales bacterium]
MIASVLSYLLLLLNPFGIEYQNEEGDQHVQFTAYIAGQQVKVHWTAEDREIIAGFYLERSRDGKTFTEFRYIADESSTPGSSEYLETDNSPLLGWSYYRIRFKRTDGKELKTHIVPVFYGRHRMQRGSVISPDELGSDETVKTDLSEFNGVEAIFVLRDSKNVEYYYEAIIAILKNRIYLPKTGDLPTGFYSVTACSKDALVGLQVTVE